METHDMKVTYKDGEKLTYSYSSLEQALNHAVQVAALDNIREVEVWTRTERRVFGYIPALPSRTLQQRGG